MASELAIPFMGSYKSRYASRLNGNTSFSSEAEAWDILRSKDGFPKFVQEFVRQNPRVRKVVYSTNTRLLNKVLKLS